MNRSNLTPGPSPTRRGEPMPTGRSPSRKGEQVPPAGRPVVSPALPQDTASFYARRGSQCQNLALLLDRFQPWGKDGDTWGLQLRMRDPQNRTERWAKESEAKRFWLRDEPYRDNRLEQIDPPLEPGARIDAGCLEAALARQAQQINDLGGESFRLQTTSRLIVGLGGESTLETAITLHRIYGFPLIPGSALKGLARAYALFTLAESLGVPVLTPVDYQQCKDNRKDTPLEILSALLDSQYAEKNWQGKLAQLCQDRQVPAQAPIRQFCTADLITHQEVQRFRAIFGYLGEAGQVVFLDALPESPVRFALDVMNPHYPKYYGPERQAPSDDQNPVPVPFLTVDAGNTFHFGVAPRRSGESSHQEAARQGKVWLQAALCQMGAGAKTLAGYGAFAPPVEAGRATVPAASPSELPSPPPPAQPRKTSQGKVRYDRGRPYIMDTADPTRRLPVNWKELGVTTYPADKTDVIYEYEEMPEGKRRVVGVTRKPTGGGG